MTFSKSLTEVFFIFVYTLIFQSILTYAIGSENFAINLAISYVLSSILTKSTMTFITEKSGETL